MSIATRDYMRLSAIDLARLVQSGEVRAEHVLEAAMEVSANRNPALNAVIAVDADLARASIEAGLPRGPLHGVPILLKDLGTPCVGTRSTYGSALFASAARWTHDCLLVERLKRAGAVIIGRTNSCEFGISLTTEPVHYGATHNPHRHGFSAGGSSGGSAAAVAAGITPLAHATDGCGSIRVPAAHCGIFGLKPGRGRISFAPDMGESWAGMSTFGCVSRDVRDTALFLDVVSGSDAGDPYVSAPAPSRYLEQLETPPEALCIGVVTAAPNGIEVHGECREAVAIAAKACESLGHTVVQVRMDFDIEEALGHLRAIWATQLWSLVAARYVESGREPDGSGMERISWVLAQASQRCNALEYAAAVRFIHRTSFSLSRQLTGLDVLLTPVASEPPPPIGLLRTDRNDLDAYMRELFSRYPFTVQFNLSGRPAMSFPIHATELGLPVGVQFAAAIGQEGLLLRLAAQLERAAVR